MKRSPLMTIMLAGATAMALLSLVLCYYFISAARQLRSLQTQVAIVNNQRQMINILAAEGIEYSKKNPAIDPILEWIGAKPARGGASNAAPPQPAAKPAGK
jgi:hypothetical protein